MFDKDPLSALDALNLAQWLAFAPLAFQATLVMRDRGILGALQKSTAGNSIDEIARDTGLSVYATRVLLEAALGLRIVWREGDCYHLGKLGRVLLEDEMTRINFDFTRDICYRAAAHLDESLRTGQPAGLKELGTWATLYEGLSVLPEPARSSWHAFDHFYSDQAFPVVCDRLAAQPPQRLLELGCNTGRWAELYLQRFAEAQTGLVDLPAQLERARQRLTQAGVAPRAHFHAINVLDPQTPLPSGYDLVWMSQFLDCFSEAQIVTLLTRVRDALPAQGRVWILELFWDRQRFEAAAMSLQQTSLYFTCVANGNSQMYDSAVFMRLVEQAGLKIDRLSDGIGGYHTLLECTRAQ